MDLQRHYDQLFSQSLLHIRQHNVKVDPLIDDPADNRRGITLLLRPPTEVKTRILGCLEKLKQIEPSQYYYTSGDIHLTILSIISCFPGFNLSEIEPARYQDIIQESLEGMSALNLHIRGMTLAPGAVLAQGFVEQDALNKLRDRLRIAFAQSSLYQTLDKRYRLETAHSTVVRFRQPLTHTEAFIQQVEAFREVELGHGEIDTLELVYNDWYQREEVVQPVARFFLT